MRSGQTLFHMQHRSEPLACWSLALWWQSWFLWLSLSFLVVVVAFVVVVVVVVVVGLVVARVVVAFLGCFHVASPFVLVCVRNYSQYNPEFVQGQSLF